MEKAKYYRPEIEEFHEGFICEIESSWGWQKGAFPTVLKSDTLSGALVQKVGYWESLPNLITSLRVKYLDKEDIESEGWKHTGRAVDEWFEIEGDFSMGSWTSYKATMHYGLHDQRMYIQMWDTGVLGPNVFQGTIKNINELRKLMKQLNIK